MLAHLFPHKFLPQWLFNEVMKHMQISRNESGQYPLNDKVIAQLTRDKSALSVLNNARASKQKRAAHFKLQILIVSTKQR